MPLLSSRSVFLTYLRGGIGGASIGFIYGFIVAWGAAMLLAIISWTLGLNTGNTGDTGKDAVEAILKVGVLGGVSIGFLYGLRQAYREETAKREEAAEKERQARQKEMEEQKQAAWKAKLELELARKNKEEIERQEKNLASMLAVSKERYLWAQRLVTEAEKQLGYSDVDFKERAFAPYWDRIEFVATSLAKYRNEIDSIKQTAINYNNQASKIASGVPAFVLPSQTQPDAEAIVQRLQSSVRKAQTDFQFASIFEQRRTNKLLADGFGTLAETINTIGQTMKSSLSGLSHTLQASLDEYSRVSQSQHEEQLAQQAKLKSAIIDGLDRQERKLEDIAT